MQIASGRSEPGTCAWRPSTGPAAASASRWTGCGTSTRPAARAKGPSGTSPYDPAGRLVETVVCVCVWIFTCFAWRPTICGNEKARGESLGKPLFSMNILYGRFGFETP